MFSLRSIPVSSQRSAIAYCKFWRVVGKQGAEISHEDYKRHFSRSMPDMQISMESLSFLKLFVFIFVLVYFYTLSSGLGADCCPSLCEWAQGTK